MTVRAWPLTVLSSAAVALSTLAPVASAQTPAAAQPAVPPAVAPTKPAAVVNGEPVSLADVDAILSKLPPPPQPLTETQHRQIRMEILARMIDDLLVQQYLKECKVAVNPADVEKEIAGLSEQLKSQGKSLQEFCKENGQSEWQLRRDVSQMMQWGAYLKPMMSEAAVKKYFDDNRDFFDQVTVRASHLMLRIPPEAAPADKQAIRTRLGIIRQDIVAGKLTFADAVAKYSDSPSKANGGDLGFFPRKMLVDEAFAKPAFAMKVGDLSDLIETETGVHLIQVVDRKPGTPAVYEKIKDDVRDLYVEEIRQAVLGRQRKVCKVEVNLP